MLMGTCCSVCNRYPCHGCTGALIDEQVRLRARVTELTRERDKAEADLADARGVLNAVGRELDEARERVEALEDEKEAMARSGDRSYEAVKELRRLAKRKQPVVDHARLVALAWMGDAVDGGKALREALPGLRDAIAELDENEAPR